MRLALFSVVTGYFFCATLAGNEKEELGICEKVGTRCRFFPASTEYQYCFSAPVWDSSFANTYFKEMSGGAGTNSGHTKGRPPSVCFCPRDKSSKARILNPKKSSKDVTELKKVGFEIDGGQADEDCRTWGAECILDEKNEQCRLIIDNDPAKTYCLPLPVRAGKVNYLYAVKPNPRDPGNEDKVGCYCQNWQKAGGFFMHPAISMTVWSRKVEFEKKIRASHEPSPTFEDFSVIREKGKPAIGVPCL